MRRVSGSIIASLVLITALWAGTGERLKAAPRASLLLREARLYLRTARRIEAKVRIHRYHKTQDSKTRGDEKEQSGGEKASGGEEASGGKDSADKRATLSIRRPRKLTWKGEKTRTLKCRELRLRRNKPALRLLTLTLAGIRLGRQFKHLGAELEREVMTLDRIDDRYVWAIGDGKAAVWLDREVYRPVRVYLGKGALNEHQWIVNLTYDDEGEAKGWFPEQIELRRDKSPYLMVEVLDVELHRR